MSYSLEFFGMINTLIYEVSQVQEIQIKKIIFLHHAFSYIT